MYYFILQAIFYRQYFSGITYFIYIPTSDCLKFYMSGIFWFPTVPFLNDFEVIYECHFLCFHIQWFLKNIFYTMYFSMFILMRLFSFSSTHFMIKGNAFNHLKNINMKYKHEDTQTHLEKTCIAFEHVHVEFKWIKLPISMTYYHLPVIVYISMCKSVYSRTH